MSDYDYIDDEDKYSAYNVKLVGFGDLDEDDQNFIRETLRLHDGLYVRYDFINDKYEVLKHNHIVGWLPEGLVNSRGSFFEELEDVDVTKIKKKHSGNVSVEVSIYLVDKDGTWSLPEREPSRNMSVIESELWDGELNQHGWSDNWYYDVSRDELSYKYNNMYGSNELANELGYHVDAQFSYFVDEFMAGNFQTYNNLEDFIINDVGLSLFIKDVTKLAIAQQVLRKRIYSYLEHRSYKLKGNDAAQADTPSTNAEAKTYEPHFRLDYGKDDGNYASKTVKNSNMNVSVVGMKYRDNYNHLLEVVKEGVTLTIKPDLTNEYDKNAIAFYMDGNTLVGYVSKKDKPFVELFLKQGSLKANVTYADEGYVRTIVMFSKADVDDSIIEKYKMKISVTTKTKVFGAYIEKIETCNLEDMMEYLN